MSDNQIPLGLDDGNLNAILNRVNAGAAVLFLGSGTTRNCRSTGSNKGATGDELAADILAELGRALNLHQPVGFTASLTEAAELFSAVHPGGRAALDEFLEKRLEDLRPTLGHYIAASFPWRAIVTANYNRVMERAWASARAESYAGRDLVAVCADSDIATHSGNALAVRLYKPHGCLSVPNKHEHPMIITSQDYFQSGVFRTAIYGEIKKHAQASSTVFIGYSLNDYTFRNIYYAIARELGMWAQKAYGISPYSNPLHFEWTRQAMGQHFNTVVAHDGFDTLMLRLLRRRGNVHPALLERIEQMWPEMAETNKVWMGDLSLDQFRAATATRAS
jgi:hypothetical protein